jgi:carbon-monoxide dehydrogenase medium subunit
MIRFEYYRPKSLEEAWELKEKIPDARFIAGGTDVMVGIRNGDISPPALLSLRSIPGLDNIEAGETTRIGALTTIMDLIHHPSIIDKFPILVEAAKELGSPQIRNVATVGGNLCNCSPCADMVPPLLVLEARVQLQSSRGSRIIPLEELFVGPGESCLFPHEILTDILLDSPHRNAKTIYLKKGRMKMDLAVASVALLVEVEGERCQKARIAAGSVAPVPLRLKKVEALIEKSTLTRSLISQAQKLAAESVVPLTDIRASEEYRREIVGILVKRALEKILERNSA